MKVKFKLTFIVQNINFNLNNRPRHRKINKNIKEIHLSNSHSANRSSRENSNEPYKDYSIFVILLF